MSMEEIVKSIEDTIKNDEYCKLLCDVQQEPLIRTHHIAYNPATGKTIMFSDDFYNYRMIKVYVTTYKRTSELMNDLARRLDNLGIAHDVDEKFAEIWTKDYIISFENIFASYSRYNSNITHYVDMTDYPKIPNTRENLEIKKMHHRQWTQRIEFDSIVEVIKNVKNN